MPGLPYKITSTGKLIDDALQAIEKENPKLKGLRETVASVGDRRTNSSHTTRFAHRRRSKKTSDGRRPTLQARIDPANRADRVRLPAKAARRGCAAARINLSLPRHSAATTGSLIDLIPSIPSQHADLHAKDILGHFFSPNGAQCLSPGQRLGSLPRYRTQALKGRHKPRRKRPNQPKPITWRPAAKNRAIRSIEFRSDDALVVRKMKRATGVSPLPNSFTQDQFPDLRPHSNSSFAFLGDLCAFAVNSSLPANFAWVQHMLQNSSGHSVATTDLAPNGSMVLLLANGSMSSNSSGEGDIRRALIEANLVECMVGLPGPLFTNNTIPAHICFLTKNKNVRADLESLTILLPFAA